MKLRNSGDLLYGMQKKYGFSRIQSTSKYQMSSYNSRSPQQWNTRSPMSASQVPNHPLVWACECGNDARLLTVKKQNENFGRQFYACDGCSAFSWAEQMQDGKKLSNKFKTRQQNNNDAMMMITQRLDNIELLLNQLLNMVQK